jgi:hypothetical protein
MALTFPLTLEAFADTLVVEAGSGGFELRRFEESSGTGRGEIITRQIAPPAWAFSMALAPMRFSEAARVRSIMQALGSSNRARFYDFTHHYPASDPTGSVLGAASVTISSIAAGGRAIALAGLPSGYQISAGDYASVGYSSGRRALLQFAESGVANGAGLTSQLEVRPHLPAAIAAGSAVLLKKPWALFILSYEVGGATRDGVVTGASISGISVPS